MCQVKDHPGATLQVSSIKDGKTLLTHTFSSETALNFNSLSYTESRDVLGLLCNDDKTIVSMKEKTLEEEKTHANSNKFRMAKDDHTAYMVSGFEDTVGHEYQIEEIK